MILDLQNSLIIISNKKELLEANKAFFDFFGFNNLQEFKAKHSCICEYFVENINGCLKREDWKKYWETDEDILHKACMQGKDKKIHIFQVDIKKIGKSDEFAISFHDITLIENIKNKLDSLNKDLEQRIQKAVEENTKKDQLLQQQSKLAAMGEMIGAIAHQWRQPLNALAINVQNLEDDYEDGLLDEKFLNEFIEKNMKTIQFMSKTIDDFRNFFRVDKKKKDFNILNAVKSVIDIQEAQLDSHGIKIQIDGEDFLFNGYESEFKQVILNIINNAKDAIIEKGVKEGKIKITLKDNTISIQDNGGGIPEDIKMRIFEPYFTTKEPGHGTGMGLYMSKMIIEKNMDGKIEVVDTEDGAIFIIKLQR
jgi:signal transduction histidine kinase